MLKLCWNFAITAIVVLIAASGVARSELIVNGSFELGAFNPDVSGGDYETIFAGDSRLIGWTIGGEGINRHMAIPAVGPANSGQFMVDLNLDGDGLDNTGTISQSFATTVGTLYRLQFSMAGPDLGFGDPRLLGVQVAGLDLVYGFLASDPDALIWGRATLDFVAIDTTTTLTFSSLDGEEYWGPFIDDVSVAAVPEPAGLAMLGLASVGLLTIARRRRPA